MDFFLSSDFYPASANAAACSEDIQAARCAMQTDAQPPTLANSKCGLGDGDESDLEWLEAETPRQVNIWTAASAG